ncbi:hypothetical protein LDENG_00150760 [Lucifuga dentata]|nr:hypothetical protein LDENG_00150760 [Lucifuga dentata]
MASLIQHYGQPHQLALRQIAEVLDGPAMKSGDTIGFRKFALRVRALVGMLQQLGEDGHIELQCGSHVVRLSKKLSHDLRATFRRYLYPIKKGIPSLLDFSEWLESELQIQEGEDRLERIEDVQEGSRQRKECQRDYKDRSKQLIILLGSAQTKSLPVKDRPPTSADTCQPQKNTKPYCPYCSNNLHYLDQCTNFEQLSKEQKTAWLRALIVAGDVLATIKQHSAA